MNRGTMKFPILLLAAASAVVMLAFPSASFAGGAANHSCSVLSSGKVNCWGDNPYGQLGNDSLTLSNVPVEVSGITNAVGVSVGMSHSCAVLSSGKVNCWGENDGQLGNNSTTQSKVPVEVSGITNAVRISLSDGHSCAVLSSGKVNCWGYNASGQLGNNSTTRSNVPVEVSGITNAVEVSLGRSHSCAGLLSGKVNCWGRNGYNGYYGAVLFGALGNGSNEATFSSVPVEVSNVSTFMAFEYAVVAPADTTAPSTPGSFTGVPSSPTTSTSATIGFTLGESGGTVECRVDSGSWGSCSSVEGTNGSHTVSGLSDGSHTVSVRQTNAANKTSEVGTTSSWTVDTVKPDKPVLSGAPSSTTTATSQNISWGAVSDTSGIARYECSTDGGGYSTCTSPQTRSGIAVGSRSFAVRAVDNAGNVGDAETASWTVQAPVVAPTILTPAAGTKTVYRTTVGGKSTWAMKLGLLFGTGGNANGAAQILTVQVAVDGKGLPVTAKPSDSQPLPTAPTFAQGVVSWSNSGEVTRQTVAAPVWVRVGNRVGKWTGWVKLTQ